MAVLAAHAYAGLQGQRIAAWMQLFVCVMMTATTKGESRYTPRVPRSACTYIYPDGDDDDDASSSHRHRSIHQQHLAVPFSLILI